jgi:hypothetical protein
MTHLTREELQRWWSEGRPADRARVLAHLAECDHCGALYAEVIDAQPVTPLMPDTPALVARAQGLYPGVQADRGRRWPLPALAGLAAAAVLVAALVLPQLADLARSPSRQEEAPRGSSLQPLSPVGTVDAPIVFRWSSPIASDGYVIEVRDNTRLMFRLRSERTAMELLPEHAAALVPGRPYSWTVVGVTATGEEMLRAGPTAFIVSASKP